MLRGRAETSRHYGPRLIVDRGRAPFQRGLASEGGTPERGLVPVFWRPHGRTGELGLSCDRPTPGDGCCFRLGRVRGGETDQVAWHTTRTHLNPVSAIRPALRWWCRLRMMSTCFRHRCFSSHFSVKRRYGSRSTFSCSNRNFKCLQGTLDSLLDGADGDQ